MRLFQAKITKTWIYRRSLLGSREQGGGSKGGGSREQGGGSREEGGSAGGLDWSPRALSTTWEVRGAPRIQEDVKLSRYWSSLLLLLGSPSSSVGEESACDA